MAPSLRPIRDGDEGCKGEPSPSCLHHPCPSSSSASGCRRMVGFSPGNVPTSPRERLKPGHPPAARGRGSHHVPVPPPPPPALQMVAHQCLIRLTTRCLSNRDGCWHSAYAELMPTLRAVLGDRDGTGDAATPGPHLIADELPLLLVVILVEQLHLVWGQVHGVLRGDRCQGWGSPPKTPPRPVAPQLAQHWVSLLSGGMMGTSVGGWGHHHLQVVSIPLAMDPSAMPPPGVPKVEGRGQEEKLDPSIHVTCV